jgi:basic membrane protein A
MDDQFLKHYLIARKMGMKEYNSNISKGKSGYLPYLEGLLKNAEIVTEVSLGTVDIPLRKIVGTLTHARSISFAPNFMPLMAENTEFAQKWANLSLSHMKEGIRDPITVYEYLNWFYVVEGNKRVSVLKYFDAHSFSAKITRLIPKRDKNNLDIEIYYEFLHFYKKTGINIIWFSQKGSFDSLLKYIENFEPKNNLLISGNKYTLFTNSVYLPFRKAYHEAGGGKLPITTGDAFLEYIKLYGLPVDVSEFDLKQTLKNLMLELEHMVSIQDVDVQTQPFEEHEPGIFSTIATFIKPKKTLKVAFAYAKNTQESNWTNSHEWGRRHVEKTMEQLITTSYVENVPEGIYAYDYLKNLAEQGNDIIFATSPAFINATLKAALEYPNVRFLNCSQTKSFKHVNTYFGRIYEPRFLSGVVAGSVTQSNILGYVGTHPISEVISGINSFALGAKMVNPRVKVKVEWTNEWDSPEKSQLASIKLINSGADVISHHNTLANREFCKEFGVYTAVCNVDKENCVPSEYLATPVWNWGIFYEKIITDILNDTWKSVTDIFGAGSRLINYWWGMDSGIVDIFYSKKHVPRETQKLLQFLKKMIESNAFHPFTGPIYDQQGNLRVGRDEYATHDTILSMNWLVDAVESDMPKIGKRSIDPEIYVPIVED